MNISRRRFSVLATSFAFMGLARQQAFAGTPGARRVAGYGALEPDSRDLMDLPSGFSYRIISRFQQQMTDGLLVPDRADGMGCIPLGDNRVALVRNHELQAVHAAQGPLVTGRIDSDVVYDARKDGTPLPGGTTTIVYNLASGEVEREYLCLVGTIRNCAGGVTPWGSWLSCEEDVTRAGDGVLHDHGWVFEVPAAADSPVAPKPLKGLGRFNHEAAAVDPRTGIVYLTEDRNDSLFYRFVPKTYGKLEAGGRLQALAFSGAPGADSRNWHHQAWHVDAWRDAVWIDLEDTDSPNDDLRNRGHAAGAALFARGEGIHWGDGELYFCCTSGGKAGLGQIMRYRPSLFEGNHKEGDEPGQIRLFLESTDPDNFNFGDNLTVAPNGHLFVCEDQYTDTVINHLRGVTPDGRLYDFARIRVQTEPAGACFSPDGSTLFVNLYSPAKTLAITGPWDSVSEAAA
jgi:secreted PhoX family phosphatase